MRILLLCHAFNSLTQRIYCDLVETGAEVSVEFDISDEVTTEAVELWQPVLVIAPFLKRAIPESVFSAVPCFIVHPGPPGDRGPAALDWAVWEGLTEWGVTVLQAEAELDGGPVWAHRRFPIRQNVTKGSLYRHEITSAAAEAVAEAVEKFSNNGTPERFPLGEMRHCPPRSINWNTDDTATVLRKLRSADGRPGIKDGPYRLFDPRPAEGLTGEPGEWIATSNGAAAKATIDGAVWVGRMSEPGGFKLPAAHFLPELPEIDGYRDCWYEEIGSIGYVHFDIYNGAMSPEATARLRAVYGHARTRSTKAIMLCGGTDFWSNGMDLNAIEGAENAAEASWGSINAIDDLVLDVLETRDKLVGAHLSGNAGAGGCFLALAADRVTARSGVILNPHYKNMGNLYGSEYWTYLLPRRVTDTAAIVGRRLPMGTMEALRSGFLDDVAASARMAADALLRSDKVQHPSRDQLSVYRNDELRRMKRNFFGFDPSYHVARYNFVFDVPKSRTPLFLARHR